MGKLIDLTNNIYGRIHIIGRAPNKGKHTQWYGWCECEIDKPLEKRTIKNYSGDNLRNGHTKSCGCLMKETSSKNHLIDLTNQQFNDLFVLERAGVDNTGKNSTWKVQCKCGKIFICSASELKAGQQSCRECANKKVGKLIQKNLTNQRFGKLIALEPTEERKHDYVVWKCQCDCGNICYVPSVYLTTKTVQSCGCLRSSIGEWTIQKILDLNNIPYIKEYSFKNCYFPNTNKLARFDFYINNQYCIEYDGKQHFNSEDGWDEPIENIQYRDNIKNKYCKENNIPLIRIPYTHLNEICLEDLLLETSKFIINKEQKASNEI